MGFDSTISFHPIYYVARRNNPHNLAYKYKKSSSTNWTRVLRATTA
jgi:hypothetical protein